MDAFPWIKKPYEWMKIKNETDSSNNGIHLLHMPINLEKWIRLFLVFSILMSVKINLEVLTARLE